MSRKRELLSDKISNLLNTAPGIIDPEDDIYQETTAKVVSNETFDTETSDIEVKSKFRKQNLELLENVDKRYAGKRGSRKDFDNSFLEEDEKEVQSSESIIESSENDSNLESDQKSVDQEGSAEDHDEDNEAENDEKVTSFKTLKDINIDSQVEKGNCVKKQLIIWENLLEIRIKLQKCLVNANRLPQRDAYQEIRNKCQSEFDSKVSQTRQNLTNTLNKFLNLQDMLLKSYPETQNLGRDVAEKIDDDVEIPSDTEDENDENEDREESKDEPPSKKCKTLSDFEVTISNRHSDYRNYRNSVIKKWNDKTRLSTAKDLGKNTNTIVSQIEHILKDREKSIKRTQLKRSNYHIIGTKETELEKKETDSNETSDKPHRAPEEYNPEIYDDDDFYHQLLRELIEYKSSDITDPIKLSRQWIQLQNMRNKMKRKIDTRATKGRKIRYTVHTKLVNFMAPIPDHKWTDEAKNELYNSLFGSKMLSQNSKE